MLPMGEPGRIGLEGDSAENGRIPATGWLMLRAIRKLVPCEPRYPTIAARFAASCLCRLTFHDRTDALRNSRSTVTGARAVACVRAMALSSGTETAAAKGIANGGFPAVPETAVVPGSSTASPYTPRTTVRP